MKAPLYGLFGGLLTLIENISRTVQKHTLPVCDHCGVDSKTCGRLDSVFLAFHVSPGYLRLELGSVPVSACCSLSDPLCFVG